MAFHLKGVFLSWLLLFVILMEEAKPLLVKRKTLKQRVKILEEKVTKLEVRMKAIEECDACSKIKELNKTVQEIIDTKPELADCGNPGVPEHGSKTGENYWAGGLVTFTCDAGYHMEGSANLVCLENGNWNNAPPKCQRLCNKPTDPENGYLEGSEFWEGKSVTYKCNEHYELQGTAVRVCNEDGKWTGEEPTCEAELADCGDPGVPEHGSKTGENYLEGGTVTFTCDAGYHLEGSANLVCLENGNWNNDLPKCSKLPSAVAGLEDSEILNKDNSYLKALGVFLKPVTHSNTQWKRCWQGSVNDSAAAFHSLCDDKGPTVTIVRVDHKYIFGGYTSLSWKDGGSCWKYDSAAFLFSLVNKPGWKPVKLEQRGKDRFARYSINTCANYGPRFGAGYDLNIAYSAPSNIPSYSNLGRTYNAPTGHSAGSDFANSFLAGSYYFQPDEVEVFYETT